MNWIEKLKNKWNIKSSRQFVIILVVFALTGTTVVLIKRPIVAFFAENGTRTTTFNVIYFICILPLYNLILLFYGSLLCQFYFFWAYEKKMIRRFKIKKRDKNIK